ncbi:MAG: Cache 3/Cache 2 fusion domain-containing protein [Bacteroidales bacterium]
MYIPILIGIIIAVLFISVYSVHKLRNNIYLSIERNLTMEVNTIIKMFERERDMKLDKVKTDLKVAHEEFFDQNLTIGKDEISIPVINQITLQQHFASIEKWLLGGNEIYNNFEYVDKIQKLVGGTITIFQKIDSGYVRISTNVLKEDGSRAVGTYIPNDSPVIKTIEKGETYIGRAYVVNSWYITAYEPVMYKGEIVGMLYVGDKEKDLIELRNKLVDLKIGKSGFPFVLDEDGTFIIHPFAQGENWKDEPIISEIIDRKTGISYYSLQTDKVEKIVAFDYFADFRLYIAAAMPVKEEAGKLIREMIINSIIIGLVIILAFSIFVYFITAENVRKFLRQLEHSSKKLKSTQDALAQSERHFQTLFNNSSDDIFVIDFAGNFIEVNQVACNSLGYSREEFLKMNIRDIKSEKHLENVDKNILMITKFGQYRYESENIAKDGKIIPVEMKSRVIDFKGEQVILSIVRDISERKEIEERILTTIIQTEENERKRFAADLHDDLGPILSTVKLYADLLKKGNFKNISQDEALKNIEELVETAITTSREISRNIRPNILQDFGLAAAVNDFCSYINSTKAIQINVNTNSYTITKRGIEETILYQSVKELINNTIKHSNAKNVKIDLKSFENQIILYYRDDGVGFDVNAALKERDGLGLNNIVNKIKSVKGTVDINSEPGIGMFLIASIKLKENS